MDKIASFLVVVFLLVFLGCAGRYEKISNDNPLRLCRGDKEGTFKVCDGQEVFLKKQIKQ